MKSIVAFLALCLLSLSIASDAHAFGGGVSALAVGRRTPVRNFLFGQRLGVQRFGVQRFARQRVFVNPAPVYFQQQRQAVILQQQQPIYFQQQPLRLRVQQNPIILRQNLGGICY